VLRVEAAGRVALITGDVEAPQEAALVARNPAALRAEVLLVPHHGSHTSSTDAFLAQVQPQVAVIQVGARNRYGHPAPEVLARYQGLGVPIKASPDCGAWVWRSGHGLGGEQGQCWRDQARRYWFHQPRVQAATDQVEP
jgi:competence protein ComEC